MEDESELEEGEACGDETAFVDPDVALSYIDDKLHDVLGHFQKDFEGGVSAENLGSKFGGYGSFLPTYQRSPLPQTTSPPKAANVSSRSPYHQPTENMSQNSFAVAVPSVSKNNNGSMGALSDDPSKKEIHQSTKVERGSNMHDSLNGQSKSSDSNRFKVRIKVGSDNILARNNAAIYSGLGLDISSPSSIEDSPGDCGSPSPQFNNVSLESPQTILQIMTCFSVPGEFLLSPLQGNLLQLTQKAVPTSKKWERNVNTQTVQERYEGHVAKRVKSDPKKKKVVDTKRSKSRNDINAVMKDEIDIETPAGQKIVSEALNIPLLSNSIRMESKDGGQFEEVQMGNTLVENKDAQLKERTINSDLMAMKCENVKAEAMECLENSGFGASEMDFSVVKGEVKLKAEITVEDKNTTDEKDLHLDKKQEIKTKTESKCNAAGVNFEGNKVMNERAPAVGKSTGKVENVSKSEVKRIQKEHNMNAPSSSDLLEDDKGFLSSAAAEERKNDLQSKSSHPGKKLKEKSHRDSRENLREGSYGGKDHDMLENGSSLGELRQKRKKWKNDCERDSDMPGISKREISSSLMHERHAPIEEQKMHVPPSANASIANAAPTLHAPVLIDEHWVCCDMCQKWRLLPPEMHPSILPTKWKCSMQQWLPWMNGCEVSEDETTKTVTALYFPAPGVGIPVGHSHVASSGLTTSNTLNINEHVEQSRKRKNAPIHGNASVEGSHLTHASVYPVSSQHAPIRSKNTADSIQFPNERDSRSVDHFIEKKRSKSKNHGGSSDGGHLTERSKKHSKVKSKREMDHDEYKTSKKIKKEERRHSGIDSNSGCVLASGDVPDEVKAFPAKAISSERSGVPSSKHKNISKHNSSEKTKRTKDGDIVFPEDKNKEHVYPSDVQRSDLSSKKRIVKEWKESQHNSTAQVSKGSTVNQSSSAKETYKDQNIKETKLTKSTKSEEPLSMTDSKSIKVPHSNKTLTYNGGNLNNELFEESTPFAGKRGMSGLLGNQSSEQVLDMAEPASSDLAYFQTTAVTSSSSKASGSQKRKQILQVAKTSPIESISLSPPGISSNDKVSHNKISGKDGSLCANTSNMPSSVKYPDTDVDNVRRSRKSQESMLANEPALHDFSQVNSDKDNESHAFNGIVSGRGLDDLQHTSARKDSALKGSSVARGHNHLHSANKNISLADGSSLQSRTAVLDIKGDSAVHENKRSVASLQDRNGPTHYPPDGNPQPEVSLRKEKSNSMSNKHDMQNSKAQILPSPLKENKLESNSIPVSSNASKLTTQLRRCNVENGGQHGITKQANSTPADPSSPVRKDSNSTGYALKEARDLKHKANRLKEEGKEHESTRLYFESALKYLHVASTLESPSIDVFKHCDAAQSLYSDTAKLCNFVGHAYEKSKKMAAAALAYKCVEVAYLKAAYYKYPTASKDRQMLQAIVQTPPGESPSSSASDIDNLNNNGLSKGPSSKDANSPQVTGNQLLLAARNQPLLTRLLAYTNDVNCAFDATRKSQMAIACATGNQENGKDGLSSVKTVLDFNFQSVNDLLRLVRLSMESISC